MGQPQSTGAPVWKREIILNRKDLRRSDSAYTTLFWLVLLLVTVIGIYLNNKCQPLPVFLGTTTFNERNWKFGEKGGELHTAELSHKYRLEPGKVYVLTADLTYDGSMDPFPSAFFSAGNMEIEVYFHGDSVFRHSREEKVFRQVQSVGGSCVTVSLGKDCAGKNLRVELRNPMKHVVYRRLPGITFGDHETQLRQAFLMSLPSMLLSCALIFAVVILVMLGNTVDGTQWTYIYFALFAALIVLYRAMHDLFILYIWAKPFMAVLCKYFSAVAAPIPLLMSYRYRLKPYFKVDFNTLVGASIFLLSLDTVLHFTGILDIMDMEPITHIWLTVVMVIMVLIGLNVRKQSGQKNVLQKILPIFIGAFVEMGHYYFHKFADVNVTHYATGDFIGVGLLISLILLIWEARKARIDAAKEAERNNILERLAYSDTLTGIKNRAAFAKALTTIGKGKANDLTLLVVSADLNGLKHTNDTMGHMAGDVLIKRAADFLSESLRPYGEVYRTGGDEFFALLLDVTEEQWETIKNDMAENLKTANAGQQIPLSMALGAAPLQNGNINQAIQLSDERMYAHKQSQYQEKGEDVHA